MTVRRVLETLALAAGTTARARELREIDAALRHPVATSRRIAVVQSGGGAGATTLVARTARALARRRGGGVLAVDAAAGDAALARALGGAVDARGLEELVAATTGVTRSRQARALLPDAGAGLVLAGRGGTRVPDDEVVQALGNLVGRFFDVVVTDWGHRTADEATRIARRSHAVAVMARADRADAERGLVLAARLATEVPTTLVLADVGATAGPTSSLLREAARTLEVPVRVLAHGHEGALRDPAARLPRRARTAYARTAGLLLASSQTPVRVGA